MSLIKAFFLGLLQGLTEFFPVSSSAHLKLAKIFFGIESSEREIIFDLMCHLGTLIALLFFLRHDIYALFQTRRKQMWFLILALVPLIPCYMLLKPLRDFASKPQYLGLCLMGTAGILFFGQHFRLKREECSSIKRGVSDALWIGALQSAALIPGISRSASTLSCARVLGWSPKDAVRFSFLLSIPTIIGGNCLELLKLALSQSFPSEISIPYCLTGFLTSACVGFCIASIALPFLEKGNLKPFAWYCLSLGICVTLYLNRSL